MESTTLVIVLAAVAAMIGIAIWLTMRRRRSDHLRERFGDEYDRTIEGADNRDKAEAALEKREERVDALDIRQLTGAEHARFAEEWQNVKAVFVDSPTEAVLHADRMLATMMKTVGYPMADFDHRYKDLTVDHADVAQHYRSGHEIVTRNETGSVNTEEMRQAMKHYEALYDHLTLNAERRDDEIVTEGGTTTGTREGIERPATAMPTTTATDVDGDGDADIVRQDVDGDGDTDRVAVKAN